MGKLVEIIANSEVKGNNNQNGISVNLKLENIPIELTLIKLRNFYTL